MAIRARPMKERFQMDSCSENDLIFLRYLCDELDDDELKKFFCHLLACGVCRTCLAEERMLTNLLGRSRPLYVAPAALRARVGDIFLKHLTRASQAAPNEHTRIPNSPDSKPLTIGTRTDALDLQRNEFPKKRPLCDCVQRLRGGFWRR